MWNSHSRIAELIPSDLPIVYWSVGCSYVDKPRLASSVRQKGFWSSRRPLQLCRKKWFWGAAKLLHLPSIDIVGSNLWTKRVKIYGNSSSTWVFSKTLWPFSLSGCFTNSFTRYWGKANANLLKRSSLNEGHIEILLRMIGTLQSFIVLLRKWSSIGGTKPATIQTFR